MEISIAKEKHLIQKSTNPLVNHNPDFYKSILEAAERGELWGISFKQNHFIQLKFDFNTSKNI
tara:strand:- start:304 stop:492 length:189 start_codon:yes stop_codon:yes gene_type:complete